MYTSSSLVVSTLLFLGNTAFSLKCFKCNSMDHAHCADPFDPKKTNLEHCKLQQSSCALVEVRMKASGEVYKVRSCMSTAVTCTELRKKAYGGDREVIGCAFCYTDTCNDDSPQLKESGVQLQPTDILILIALFMYAIITFNIK